MMTRAKRLEPVQNVAEEAERRLAQSLAAFERRVSQAETKLSELEHYRAEYEKQFSQRAGRGIGAIDLRDYQAFLARLGEAIRQQRTIAERARIERDAEKQRWQDAARRAKALDHLTEKWQSEERRLADRREQRDSDERAQRKPSRP